eukprot:4574065-Karenia_brevis.AAC.2
MEQQQEIDSLDLQLHAGSATQGSSLEPKQFGHAAQVHFDAVGADHASPVLFDMFDADSDATADHASPELFDAPVQTQPTTPVLFDAACQTEISILKSWPDQFLAINEAGQASPVHFDGDSAAGAAHDVTGP